MEVGLGSLSPEHRAELSRAGMTVVPIPRGHVTGLGQTARPGQGNVSAPFNTNPQNTVNTMLALGVTPTGSSSGAGPTCSGVMRLAYADPHVRGKLGLRPVGPVQGGLTTAQMQQLLAAFLSDGSSPGEVELPYPIPAGSNVVLAQGGTFLFNGIVYDMEWRQYGRAITPVINVCLPGAPAAYAVPYSAPYTPPVAPVAPASNTWLWILGAVVVGGIVIYAVD